MKKYNIVRNRETVLRKFLKISPILFIFLIIFINSKCNSGILQDYPVSNDNIFSDKNEKMTPDISGDYDGILNLTNHNEIDGKTFYRGTNITIEGLVYYPLPYTPLNNVNVSIIVDGILNPDFSNSTGVNGEFQIVYNVSLSLDIYQSHTIQVNVIDNLDIYYENFHQYSIYTNATSYFDITSLSPAIPGEKYNIIHGTHRFDNGTGIPDQLISSSWYNKAIKIRDNPDFNADNDGSLSEILQVPNDTYSSILHLNLNYSGAPNINNSQSLLTINLFRNITCIWNTVSSASEGAYIYIRGQVLSRNNTKIKINNRDVDLVYDGQLAGTITSNANGDFEYTFQDPGGTGNKIIEVAVVHNLGVGVNIYSNTSHTIRITSVSPSETPSTSGKSGPKDPPFFNFFLVLIPIIIGGAVAFAIFARYFLKKQKEESMLVKLPLENRIRNLKILKETGRMEESLSYLFQSIYMELINGKYGRRIKETETIRDFAIISVKNLNLNPATIYPFIQKVEEIIYARPFIINDKDFYETVELFSPIYFELTGYNFVLNF